MLRRDGTGRALSLRNVHYFAAPICYSVSMIGSLIFVSGVSGAGKTTLIRHALEHVPNLVYLKTVTTRPQRPDEAGKPEYEFVTNFQYEKRQLSSKNWDHADYNGFKYGADVDGVRRQLRSGINVICSVMPDLEIMQTMRTRYKTIPFTIWIDTPAEVAKERIQDDLLRLDREEDDAVKASFGKIFTPTGDLKKDKTRFTELLKPLLA